MSEFTKSQRSEKLDSNEYEIQIMSQTVNVSSGRHNEESTLSRLNQIKYSDPCCKSCLF